MSYNSTMYPISYKQYIRDKYRNVMYNDRMYNTPIIRGGDDNWKEAFTVLGWILFGICMIALVCAIIWAFIELDKWIRSLKSKKKSTFISVI